MLGLIGLRRLWQRDAVEVALHCLARLCANAKAPAECDIRSIAFMSFREGYCAVFRMTADGNEQINLTPKDPADPPTSWFSRAPSWSAVKMAAHGLDRSDVMHQAAIRRSGCLLRLQDSGAAGPGIP